MTSSWPRRATRDLAVGRSGPGRSGPGRGAVLVLVVVGGLALLGLIITPMLVVGGSGLLFESGSGCSAAQGGAQQPVASSDARNSIPANYLALFQETGKKYGVPWVVLAGIGEVESDDGRSNLPGVHSGSNAFGAAGPMQIGIGGAAGNEWGGAPVHPASEHVNGVATDGDGDGIASVYDPADAIAGAAKMPGRERGADQRLRRDLRLQPPAVLRAARAVTSPGPTPAAASRSRPVTVANVPSCLPGVNTRRRHHAGAQPHGGGGHLLCRGPARQAVPVGRDRAGRLRLLRPGDDGLPGGGRVHPAHRGRSSASGDRRYRPARSSPGTWSSSPAPTGPPPRPATSAW